MYSTVNLYIQPYILKKANGFWGQLFIETLVKEFLPCCHLNMQVWIVQVCMFIPMQWVERAVRQNRLMLFLSNLASKVRPSFSASTLKEDNFMSLVMVYGNILLKDR